MLSSNVEWQCLVEVGITEPLANGAIVCGGFAKHNWRRVCVPAYAISAWTTEVRRAIVFSTMSLSSSTPNAKPLGGSGVATVLREPDGAPRGKAISTIGPRAPLIMVREIGAESGYAPSVPQHEKSA